MPRFISASQRGLLLPALISLGIHGVLLAIPASLQVAAPASEEADRIEISLAEISGAETSSGPAAGLKIDFSSGPADAGDVSLPAPTPPSAAVSVASREVDPRPDVHRVAVEKKPAPVQRAPSPADVLSDTQALTGVREASTAVTATVKPEEQTRRVEQELGWEGKGRTLLKRVDPQFPDRLAVAGVEADCEARIAVSPGGNVVRVEITRGSGYIEIDRNVEAALRQFVFSRSDSDADAAGTVRFRFRLGRRE